MSDDHGSAIVALADLEVTKRNNMALSMFFSR
jgi:hypothetical protein